MILRKTLLLAAALFMAAGIWAGYSYWAPGRAQFLNDRSREIIGADLLNAPGFITPAGLTGKGQVVAVADSGIDKGSLDDIHPDLANESGKKPKIIMLRSWAGRQMADDPVGHGTHMVGTIAGSGISSGGEFRGVAPDASIYFQGILDDKGRVVPPQDVEKLFLPAYQANARIHVNAWGTDGNSYTESSRKADSFVRGHPDFLVIFGAGNSGPGAKTLTSEANSKNSLVVGSSLSPRPALDFSTGDTLDTAQFSSRGPAADGRIKPDLLAPGTSIISTRSSLVKGNLPGFPMYTRMQGSSMASAVAAGSAALMREYMQREMAIPRPHAASVKAALINGARTPETGPSGQGFGVLDLAGTVLALKEKTMALEEEIWGLPDGGIKTYKIKVEDPGSPFKATLAWTDPAGDPQSKSALVNNLDLIVTAPDGREYYGNGFLGAGPDAINNVEQVYINNPTPGEYLVQVRAASVKVPAVRYVNVDLQDYSLAYGQLLSTGIVRQPGAGGVIDLQGGKRVNTSGKEVHYIFNGSSSEQLPLEPGYRVYHSVKSVYVVGRQWSPDSAQFREGAGGRVWFESDRDSLMGGYYQNRDSPRGATVNGIYSDDLSGLPPGIGLKASLDGLTQTLWRVVTGYATVKGNVERTVRGENGEIISVALFRDNREYRVSPGASYIYSDTFGGGDPAETVFGAVRLDGLDRIMPGQQVTLVLAPVSGTVNSILVNRTIVSGYVAGVNPEESKITIGSGQVYKVFAGAGVQKDRAPSSLKNIAPGDYVTAVTLPGARDIIGILAYSNVAHGQVLFTSDKEKTIYVNDHKNGFQMYGITPDTEVRRWGLVTDASTLTSGTWVRSILSPDGREMWYMDVAELLEDEQKELASLDSGALVTRDGELYRISDTITRITKEGLPVTLEDLRPGEKATLVSLLAPAPYKKVLVSVRVRQLEGVRKPFLVAGVREDSGRLTLTGNTTANRVYVWHESGLREDIPVDPRQGTFAAPLKFLGDEAAVKVVAVNNVTGAVAGKTILKSEVTARGFRDIEGHWAEEAIASAVSLGIMAGYGDGTFRPDTPVTVEQLSAVVAALTGAGQHHPAEGDLSGSVTRASFMVTLKKLFNGNDKDKPPNRYVIPFSDCYNLKKEEKEAIAWGYHRGIIKGRTQQIFDPDALLTRSEAAALISRIRQKFIEQ
ncbi:MAG: S8 family serine peptidase [Bacillota bacterium]